MRKMTEANLINAFAGESQANMRYYIFANKAEKEGYPNVAKLFRAIAYAEEVHATNHFKVLGELGNSVENLGKGIEGENFEIIEMYPAYQAVAQLQEEKEALRSIRYALEAEKIHEKMFVDAQITVKEGRDIQLDKMYICEICGHTVAEDCPDVCPICGAPKNKFKEFS